MKTLQGAACATHPHADRIFWPTTIKGAHNSQARTRRLENQAKQICCGCPVKDDCLATALALGPAAQGVWGATTQAERQHMTRATRNHRR